MSDYVCIYRGTRPTEVEFITSKLEDSGIPFTVRTNDASGTMPHLALGRGIEVLVPKENETEAKAAL